MININNGKPEVVISLSDLSDLQAIQRSIINFIGQYSAKEKIDGSIDYEGDKYWLTRILMEFNFNDEQLTEIDELYKIKRGEVKAI